MDKKSGFTLIEILIALAILALTAGGVVVWKKKATPTPSSTPAFTPIPTPALSLTPTSSSDLFPSLLPSATEIQYEDLDSSLTGCISPWALFQPFEYREKEFIINSHEEYQTLYNYKDPSDPCRNYTLPEIDFSQNTLLGKYADGGGCSIDFVRKIYRDDANKEFIYSIAVVEEGACKKLRISMNWALISKISSGYTVRFEVK